MKYLLIILLLVCSVSYSQDWKGLYIFDTYIFSVNGKVKSGGEKHFGMIDVADNTINFYFADGKLQFGKDIDWSFYNLKSFADVHSPDWLKDTIDSHGWVLNKCEHAFYNCKNKDGVSAIVTIWAVYNGIERDADRHTITITAFLKDRRIDLTFPCKSKVEGIELR